MTREDHKELASQLFAGYSRVKSIRSLAAVIGEEELSDLDKSYFSFGDRFEREFLALGERENRTIEQTLDIGWKILTTLPRSEQYRIEEETLQKYLPKSTPYPASSGGSTPYSASSSEAAPGGEIGRG